MQLYLKFYILATQVTIMVLRLVIDHVFIFAADSIRFRGGYYSYSGILLPCSLQKYSALLKKIDGA